MRAVYPKDLAKGFSLEELHELLGCDCVGVVGITDGSRLVVDDDGRAKRLPLNFRATVLYQEGRGTGWAIVGDVVVGHPTEIR
jgi:hypothetical protein